MQNSLSQIYEQIKQPALIFASQGGLPP